MSRRPRPGSNPEGSKDLELAERHSLKIPVDSQFHIELTEAAARRGQKVTPYVRMLLHMNYRTDDMRNYSERTRAPEEMRELHFDQHLYVATTFLNVLFNKLGFYIPFNEKMFADWRAEPSPVLMTRTYHIPSIFEGTKEFRQKLRRVLRKPLSDEINLALATFLVAFRPLTGFDGKAALAIPTKYDKSVDEANWTQYAATTIATAVIFEEISVFALNQKPDKLKAAPSRPRKRVAQSKR